MDQDKIEPIAIIGMAANLPGEATSVQNFWEMLKHGRSAVSEVPKSRFNIDAFYHPDFERLDAINTKKAHFMRDDLESFDAHFFGISAAEASSMDPQQRRLLETSYRAFENAGISIEKVAGSATSVYVASFARDYDAIFQRDPLSQSKYQATGTGASVLANRISHFFDLRGPSMLLDTACSSSIYALHVACQSIRTGESSMALVAGCNLIYSPEAFMIPLSNAGFLSPNGISRSFDHKADGYARGEGFAAVLLKPLSQALKDNDTIRSIIRATGVNVDGRTPSITNPSSSAQAALIQQTYRLGGLDIANTASIEAHGTGTKVGDPAEANSIGSAFAASKRGHPLIIGAVKSNIGHLEGASGLTSLIKTTLSLETGMIPPIAHFEKVNPEIKSAEFQLQFPTQLVAWPHEGLRQASISSFGYGGANAHVVLNDAYHYLTLRSLQGLHRTSELAPTPDEIAAELAKSTLSPQSPVLINSSAFAGRKRLLVFSAGDELGTQRQGQALENYLEDNQPDFDDLLYTMNDRRTLLSWRSYIAVSSIAEMRHALPDINSAQKASSQPQQINFVFTGQGAAWAGMGKELLEYNVFSQSIIAATKYLQNLGCLWLASEELTKDATTSNTQTPSISQPLCTILQIALVDLLRSWNIQPSSVVGHSSGEIAAAYCVGALTRESAWKLAYYRGILSERLAQSSDGQKKSMMALALSGAECKSIIQDLGLTSSVYVGCINSPTSSTVTGIEEGIIKLETVVKSNGIFTRKLEIGCAYHSPYMRPISIEYAEFIQDIHPPKVDNPVHGVRFFSSVIAKEVHHALLSTPHYWVQNLLSPVDFAGAVSRLAGSSAQDTDQVFIELGPHPALRRYVEETLQTAGLQAVSHYFATLRQQVPADTTCLEMAGQLFARGASLNVAAVNQSEEGSVRSLLDLPPYPFNHSHSHWFESRISRQFRFRPHGRHDLLGVRDRDWNRSRPVWRNIIKSQELPWTLDHGFSGSPVYPAGGMLVMVIEAVRQWIGNDTSICGYRLKNISYTKALPVSDTIDGVETSVHLAQIPGASNLSHPFFEFHIFGMTGDEWVELCHGSVQAEPAKPFDACCSSSDKLRLMDHQSVSSKCVLTVDHEQFYRNLRDIGHEYGPSFQVLRDARYNKNDEANARINLWQWQTLRSGQSECVIHPTSLDALLHLPLLGTTQGGWKGIPVAMASSTQDLWVSAKLLDLPTECQLDATARTTWKGLRESECSMTAVDPATLRPMITVDRHIATAISSSAVPDPMTEAETKRIGYRIAWKPDLSLMSNAQITQYFDNMFDGKVWISPTEVDRVEALVVHFVTNQLPSLDKFETTLPDSKHYIRRYINWMKETSNSFAELPSRRHRSHLEMDHMIQSPESLDPMSALVVEVGTHLSRILDGSVDPLDLLFGGQLAEDFYRRSLESSGNKIAQYMAGLAHSNPQLRILEIGSGTGGVTGQIIDALQTTAGSGDDNLFALEEYCFTDISPSFFDSARKRFGHLSGRMNFKVFDVSMDPAAQGFEAEFYDVIVAAAVLHATPYLEDTLRNVRSLLKPGGKLVLAEQCSLDRLGDKFIFGTLPGWWYGTEEFRQTSPLITESKWNEQVRKTGFSGVDLVFRDFQESTYHSLSVLVSTAVCLTDAPEDPPVPQILLIDDENNVNGTRGWGTVVADALKTNGVPFDVRPLKLVMQQELANQTVIYICSDEQSNVGKLDEQTFEGIKAMALTSKQLIWVARRTDTTHSSPEHAMVQGFARSVNSERGYTVMTTVLLDHASSANIQAECIVRLIGKSIQGVLEADYVEQAGVMATGRLEPSSSFNDAVANVCSPLDKDDTVSLGPNANKSLNVRLGTPGMLDSMYYMENDLLEEPPGDDEVDVEVSAASLNFKDLLVALGQIPGDVIGFDAAGVVHRAGRNAPFQVGDRVMCFFPNALATYVRCGPNDAYLIPDSMSFAAAASVATVFGTAYYSLITVGRLQKGESVLIHAAAGGLGQAAVQLAQLVGAEVFATIGSEAKKQRIMDLYNIPESHIMSTRDASFVHAIQASTKGRGVDVVLNCLTGELLQASFDLVAPFGRFIEVGKRDILSNHNLTMSSFIRNITFASVDFGRVAMQNKRLLKDTMDRVLELFAHNSVLLHEPQPLNIFKASQIEDAFRALQAGTNGGKTVVTFESDDMVTFKPATRKASLFSPIATYVIVGGLGGLGRAIARWLSENGAKHLLLLSRSGPTDDGNVQGFLNDLSSKSVSYHAPKCDVADVSQIQSALHDILKAGFPPIKGCFHGGMVLSDCTLVNSTIEKFRRALPPKVQGSWNLHQLLPVDMDFFILLSSFAGVTGARGQINYAAANTYQDALAATRRAQGLPCVSLNLGLILGVGFAAENPQVTKRMLESGVAGIREGQFLAILEVLCSPKWKFQAPAHLITGIDTPSAVRRRKCEPLFYHSKPLFSLLHNIVSTSHVSSSAAEKQDMDYLSLVRNAGTLPAAVTVVTETLSKKLGKTLGVDEHALDPNKPIFMFGVDSLIAVELRQWILKQLKVDLPVYDILKDQKMRDLCHQVASKVWSEQHPS